jgi:DNA-binding NarL/FixJ family response regulator
MTETEVIAEARAILADDSRRQRSRAKSHPTQGAPLTAREQDVARLLVAGRSDREIADALFMGQRTASTHVSAILRKLGVATRAEAAARAARDGLV